MYSNITKRTISLLLAFSMILSMFPMTALAAVEIPESDTRDPVTRVEGITVVSKEDSTTKSIESAFKYGENCTETYEPFIKMTSDGYDGASQVYFYNAHWQKNVDGAWIDASNLPMNIFTSGTWRYIARLYIDNDDNWITGTPYEEYRIAEDVEVYVNGEQWETGEYAYASDNTSIRAWKEFTMAEPEELSFPDSSNYDIPDNKVNVAIIMVDVGANVEGGTKPYTFEKVSGPSWINVSEDGEITGTPTAIAATNDDLVVRVTDSASASKQITIAVGETKRDPATRTVISSLTASSSDIDTIPVLDGYVTTNPTITVTEATPEYFEHYPAYFYTTNNAHWEVKVEDAWQTASGTFKEGHTYRYSCHIYCDNDGGWGSETGGDDYVLAENLAVTVNGEAATLDDYRVYDEYSIVTYYSKEYQVGAAPTGSITVPTFDNEQTGYEAIPSKAVSITISNEYTVDPAKLSYELTGTNKDDFSVYLNTRAGVMEGPNTWNDVSLFHANPNEGLGAGKSTATLTLKYDVDGDDVYETIIGSGELSFTVEKAKYTVTFDAGDGTGIMDPEVVEENTDYTLPAIGFTAPEDKEFKNWYIAGYGELNPGDIITVTGDITVKAQWKDVESTPTTYTVKVGATGYGDVRFSDNEYTHGSDSKQLEEGTSVTIEAKPYSGYAFYRWRDDNNAGSTISKNAEYTFTVGTEDIDYVAEFVEYHNIIVNNGSSDPEAKAILDTEVTITANAAETGKEFDKWIVVSGDVELDDEKASETTFTMPDKDVKVEATYKDAEVTPTTSISGDKSSVDFGSIQKGFTQAQSDEVIQTVRITNNGTTTVTIDNTNPAEDGPFGVYWYDSTIQIAPGEYQDVQLRLADSSTFADTAGNYSGTYVFTATNVENSSDTATFEVTATAVLTEPAPTTYTIRVDNYDITEDTKWSGGKIYLKTDKGTNDFQSSGYGFSATENTSVEIKATPDEGYEFVEWRKGSKDGESFTTEANYTFNATETINLYAIFKKTEVTPTTTYTVSFDSNGGPAVDDQTVVSGETATKPDDPTSGDLHFIGWFVEPTTDNIFYFEYDDSGDIIDYGYNTFDFENTPITEDTELTALWGAVLQANITGAGNGQIAFAELGDELEYRDEEPYTTVYSSVIIGLNNTVKLGAKESGDSVFVKWTKSGDESFSDENKEITVTVTEDVEYIAEFKLIEYTVKYEANGGSGEMADETAKYYIFPSCDFTAPKGKTFDKWEVNGTKYKVGDTLELTEDITVTATWKTKSSGGGGGGSSNAEKETIWSKADDWAIEELTKAEKKGLIPETFAKKDFTKAITRKDFAAVAVKLYEAISGKKAKPIDNNPFVDTNDEYVLAAYNLGITNGTSETTFTPDAQITREQMATMLTRALVAAGINTDINLDKIAKFADDNVLSDWGRPSVYFMASKEIIKGIGENKFDGLGNAKIEEALAIALRSVEVIK